MKKILIGVLVILALMMLKTCGGSGSSKPAETTAAETTVATEAETKAETTAAAIETEAETEPETIEETKAPETTDEETTEAPTEAPTAAANGISPDFKAAMDSYEAYFDEYVEVMQQMKTNPSNLALLGKYAEFMSSYADTMDKFDALESQDMTNEEAAYYAEVSARITQKLLKAAQ